MVRHCRRIIGELGFRREPLIRIPRIRRAANLCEADETHRLEFRSETRERAVLQDINGDAALDGLGKRQFQSFTRADRTTTTVAGQGKPLGPVRQNADGR